MNAAFETHTGLRDPTGKSVRALQPGIEAIWLERYGRVARTGHPLRVEDHSPSMGRWFELYAFRVGEPRERRVGVLFKDITERKKVEAEKEALRERERRALAETAAARERLRAVFLQAPVGIAILSGPTHVFDLANPVYEEISGRKASELLGRSVRDVFHEIDPSFYTLLDNVFRTGESFVGKAVPIDLQRQGRLEHVFVDFIYQASRDASGKVDGILVVCHEVTDQVRAQRASESAAAERERLLERERAALAEVEAQRERLHSLFQQAPAAIAIVDGPEYVFSFVNARYEDLVRRPARDLLGRRAADVLPEVVEQGFIRLLGEVRATGRPFLAEALPVTLRQDGGERTFFLNFVYQPVYAEGEVVSIMAHAVDVTAQVTAQAEVQKLAETLDARVRERTSALEASNRDLESFSYAVSHDLRAPLRAVHHLVGNALERVEQLPASSDELRITLAAAKRSTEDMSRLIEGLLSLARAARAELRTGPVDLSAMAQDVLAQLATGEPHRRVEVSVHPGMHAIADARLVRSILDNLLGNAWKFTKERAVAHIEFGKLGNDTFFVKDDGVGFDMAEAPHLFQPFKRLDRTDGFDGTGIGLATARRAVERHGGRAWAEATPGAGATIFFTLPTEPR